MGLTIPPAIMLDGTGVPSGTLHTPSSRMRLMEEKRPDPNPPNASRDEWRLAQLEDITRSLTATATDLKSSVSSLNSKMDAFVGAHFPATDGKVMEGRVDRLERDVELINSRAWVLWLALANGVMGLLVAIILATLRWQSHGS